MGDEYIEREGTNRQVTIRQYDIECGDSGEYVIAEGENHNSILPRSKKPEFLYCPIIVNRNDERDKER